jgi:peroxin-12
LSYAFGRTEYYSPALQLAGVKLTYVKDPSPVTPPSTNAGRLFSIISQIMSSGLFLIQFVDWWNNTNGSKKNSINTNTSPPLPTTVQTRSTIGKRQCPLCRQPCNVPTAVLGSGYVYCNTCISDYVKRYQRCPTTNQPVTNEQLIKIY